MFFCTTTGVPLVLYPLLLLQDLGYAMPMQVQAYNSMSVNYDDSAYKDAYSAYTYEDNPAYTYEDNPVYAYEDNPAYDSADEGSYKCINTERVIDKARLCNTELDCPEGDDENIANCAASNNIPIEYVQLASLTDEPIKYGRYQCRDQRERIDLQSLCDGVSDCDLADDEDPDICASNGVKAISTPESPSDDYGDYSGDYPNYSGCFEDEFACASVPGTCIPLTVLCDGYDDCLLSEDENDCD